jgi:hypothetical protein
MLYSARANSPRGSAVEDLATGMRVAVVHEWLSTLLVEQKQDFYVAVAARIL